MSREGHIPVIPPRRERPLVLLYATSFGRGLGGGELTGEEFVHEFHRQGCDVVYAYHREYHDTEVTGLPDGLSIEKIEPGELLALAQKIQPDFLFSRGSGTAIESARVVEELNLPSAYYVQFWRDLLHVRDEAQLLEGGENCVLPFNELLRNGVPDPNDFNEVGARALASHTFLIANSWFSYHVLRRSTGQDPQVIFPSYVPEHISTNTSPPHRRGYTLLTSLQDLKGARIFLKMARARTDEKFAVLTTKLHESQASPLMDMAKGLPNVELLPWTDDMASVYDRAKCVFIGTMTAETFSRVALESRLSGIPLLVSDNGNLPNIALEVPIGHDYHEAKRNDAWTQPEGVSWMGKASQVGPGGVVVPHPSPIGEWLKALDHILEGNVTVKKDTEYRHSDRRHVVEQCLAAIPRRRILMVAGGGPGVQTMCWNLSKNTGASFVLSKNAPRVTVSDFDAIVCSGTMAYDWAQKVKKVAPKRTFASWNSHMSQMAFSPRELTEWLALAQDVHSGDLAGMLTSFGPDSEAYRELIGERFKWLPNTASAELTFPVVRDRYREGEELRVAILGPVAERKNLFTAVTGASAAKVWINFSSWVLQDSWDERQHPELDGLLLAYGTQFQAWKLKDANAVRSMLASSDLMINLSHSETFSYVSLEAMLVGTPVIGPQFIPVHQYTSPTLRSNLWVDPNDPMDVAQKIKYLGAHRDLLERAGKLVKEHATRLIADHRLWATEILDEILDQVEGETPILPVSGSLRRVEQVPQKGQGRGRSRVVTPSDPPSENDENFHRPIKTWRQRSIKAIDHQPPADHPARKRGRSRWKA